MDRIPREELPRTEAVTTTEEVLRWRYASVDTEPPYDPILTGMPDQNGKYRFTLMTKPLEQVFSRQPITGLHTITPRTMLNKCILYAQYVVKREDGHLYEFTDADLHNLCVYDLLFLHKILGKYMERRSTYAVSLRRLIEVMRAQIMSQSQKDFDMAIRLVQSELRISPPLSRPCWILRCQPNTVIRHPTYGFVYVDKDEIQRFFDPNETHKYTSETLDWIYKSIATEVHRGRIRRDEVEPILQTIQVQAAHRAFMYRMYKVVKTDVPYAVDDFPNSVID